MGPVVRVEQAGLGPDAHVRVVLSDVSEPQRLRAAWAPSGAVIDVRDGRLHAVTAVEALVRAAGRALEAGEAQRLADSLRAAVTAWQHSPAPVLVPGVQWADGGRALVMGVVNVTPDSFSDGGALYPDGHPQGAVAYARELLTQGADILDIGGESTRPDAEPVAEREELDRVLPVIEALAHDAVISVDTTKLAVARAALDAGARIINDVSGAADPALLALAAERDATYVLMHTRGTPAEMRSLASYDDVVAEVYEFLAAGIERCLAAGIAAERLVVDPGIGFAKTPEHNLRLMAALRQFTGLGRPLLVGASRKSFLASVLDGAPAGERLEGSLACAALAAGAGAAILRVHDVAATMRVVQTVAGVRAAGRDLLDAAI